MDGQVDIETDFTRLTQMIYRLLVSFVY